MVRYPQKNPSEPIKPQSEPVPSEPAPSQSAPLNESLPSKQVKDIKDEQVEILQQRLHSLEEKLDNIQKQAQERKVEVVKKDVDNQKGSSKELIQFRPIFIIISVFCVLIFGALMLIGHIYVSSFVLELNPKEFNWQGGADKDFSGDFIKLEEPPNFINEAFALGLTQIKTNQDGKYIDLHFYSLGPQRTRQIAENWEKNFIQRYVDYRKSLLVNRLDIVKTRYIQIQHELQDVFEQMSAFKSNEEYFLVNVSSRERLIRLAQQDALDLEKNLIDITDQLARGAKNNPLSQWSPENKALLGAYRLKLTNMEFEKFLVGGDFANIYDEGIRTIKTAAAQLINDQAQKENINEIAASLIIKDFFLSCRQQAVEAVLNKRYAVSANELSLRSAEYFQLKNNFEALDVQLGSLSLVNRQIKKALEVGLSEEVVVHSPISVVKY